MEEKGLVERLTGEEGRARYVITERGRRLLREMRRIEEFLQAFGLEI